jgi:hypothetical protein
MSKSKRKSARSAAARKGWETRRARQAARPVIPPAGLSSDDQDERAAQWKATLDRLRAMKSPLVTYPPLPVRQPDPNPWTRLQAWLRKLLKMEPKA